MATFNIKYEHLEKQIPPSIVKECKEKLTKKGIQDLTVENDIIFDVLSKTIIAYNKRKERSKNRSKNCLKEKTRHVSHQAQDDKQKEQDIVEYHNIVPQSDNKRQEEEEPSNVEICSPSGLASSNELSSEDEPHDTRQFNEPPPRFERQLTKKIAKFNLIVPKRKA